jgi:hypothetical protein
VDFEKHDMCLKVHGEDDRWLEIPSMHNRTCTTVPKVVWEDKSLYNIAWVSPYHTELCGYNFNFIFNKDGTISPESKRDLVWGLADPSSYSSFRDLIANPKGWTKSHAEIQKEKEEQVSKVVSKILDEKLG